MINRIGNLNRKQCILILANGIFIIAFFLVTVLSRNAIKDLYSQQEAQRWESKKNSYAQTSVFISPERNMQEEEIGTVRSSIMETLVADSLNETKHDERIWIDAYSGECKTEIRKDRNTISVMAVGIGNDFFQFHPLKLISGGYIAGSDLNHDRIVVDEGTAWTLFGSNDIIGMQVWIGNTPLVVAGVVSVEEDTLSKIAYGNENRIYMSYDMLKQQQEGLKITCYESVMPNPISNYAYYTVRKALGLDEQTGGDDIQKKEKNPMNFEDYEVIENTNRYGNISLISKIKNLKLQSMRTNSIGYPYWENVARVIENQQIRYLVIRILLLIVPCISLICWLSYLWKHRSWTAKDILFGIIEKIKMEEEPAGPELELEEMDSDQNVIESESEEWKEEAEEETEEGGWDEESEEEAEEADWEEESEEEVEEVDWEEEKSEDFKEKKSDDSGDEIEVESWEDMV